MNVWCVKGEQTVHIIFYMQLLHRTWSKMEYLICMCEFKTFCLLIVMEQKLGVFLRASIGFLGFQAVSCIQISKTTVAPLDFILLQNA